MGKVAVYPPVASFIGIRSRAPGHSSPNTHVIQPWLDGSQTRFDVPKTLAKCQLSETHAKELVQTREFPDFEIALITPNAFPELVMWDAIHYL